MLDHPNWMLLQLHIIHPILLGELQADHTSNLICWLLLGPAKCLHPDLHKYFYGAPADLILQLQANQLAPVVKCTKGCMLAMRGFAHMTQPTLMHMAACNNGVTFV